MENKNITLIGIIGNAESGKDFVTNIIQYLVWKKINPKYDQPFTPVDRNASGWENRKFAGKLKEIAASLCGVSKYMFESSEFKNSIMPIQWQEIIGYSDCIDDDGNKIPIYTERTYRWLLQNLGTNAIRDVIHKDCWINALFAYYDLESTYEWSKDDVSHQHKWIISDVRFLNEVKAIKDRGGILIRKNGLHKSVDGHQSESELKDYVADFNINYCDNIDDLIEEVRKILIQIGIL